jgi:hypothetical protein
MQSASVWPRIRGTLEGRGWLSMDFNEFDKVIEFFSHARNECDERGATDLAQKCDDAIGLAQEVTLVLGVLKPH